MPIENFLNIHQKFIKQIPEAHQHPPGIGSAGHLCGRRSRLNTPWTVVLPSLCCSHSADCFIAFVNMCFALYFLPSLGTGILKTVFTSLRRDLVMQSRNMVCRQNLRRAFFERRCWLSGRPNTNQGYPRIRAMVTPTQHTHTHTHTHTCACTMSGGLMARFG